MDWDVISVHCFFSYDRIGISVPCIFFFFWASVSAQFLPGTSSLCLEQFQFWPGTISVSTWNPQFWPETPKFQLGTLSLGFSVVAGLKKCEITRDQNTISIKKKNPNQNDISVFIIFVKKNNNFLGLIKIYFFNYGL